MTKMTIADPYYELTVLDGPDASLTLTSLAVGDIDGDGDAEIVTGGVGGLYWYRPGSWETGTAATGQFRVGLALEDVDGDGRLEAVLGDANRDTGQKTLEWLKPQDDLNDPWQRHVIDPSFEGTAHDILFADLDGDGRREMVVNACYTSSPGLFVYKPYSDVHTPWRKHAIQTAHHEEGLAAADVDGDGRLELLSGPAWYSMPLAGPYDGFWQRHAANPGMRELCRLATVDISGTGRPEVILVESEYLDGRLVWMENRFNANHLRPWREHVIDDGLWFAHSLQVFPSSDGAVRLLVGEMDQGGFGAPVNRAARLLLYTTNDHGATWERLVLSVGVGTHQAVLHDIDHDGVAEIVGKNWNSPQIQIWKKQTTAPVLAQFRHRFIDRDKPDKATDLMSVDLDGDGSLDLICGRWWYRNLHTEATEWPRYEIPGIAQVTSIADIDSDGKSELIATMGTGLNAELCWCKPIDPIEGVWEINPIGIGTGDWPHSTIVAPVLPGGGRALLVGWHNGRREMVDPELFEIPSDPRSHPWPSRPLARLAYGEQLVAIDLTGKGFTDVLAGEVWLENLGDGSFKCHRIAPGFFRAARIGVADLNGDGRMDVILGEELLDFDHNVTPLARLAWFEQPEDPRAPWAMHVIDRVRCPHSLSVADLDGDGELEVVVAEHDPFAPFRSRCQLVVYKKADVLARSWRRYLVDSQFEHHVGATVAELQPGHAVIFSQGWTEKGYVHLWERASE